ncbi:MAG: hypothetical protein ETSY1_09895 [Candidatus Entotheonella factor]|uniref:CoA transferase n=1 Tax=Entotheonella factor TaxID=1429438 RepID=W4LTQ9_ENTF1|nr:MAG: hypothetical protein ETSY1_09895 [Candidatus Entotheonella factor]
MTTTSRQQAPLVGATVLEIAGGDAGAYCAKLFADLGASVSRVEPASGDPMRSVRLDPEEPATEGLYHSYLNAGKQIANHMPAPDTCDILNARRVCRAFSQPAEPAYRHHRHQLVWY